MKYLLLFLILFSPSLTHAASQSIMSKSTGGLIVSGNGTTTVNNTLLVNNRRMRFNTTIPGPTDTPIGAFDIFTGTTEIKALGFGEFREVSDPNNPLYNSVEAPDPVGAHFFFTANDTTLSLQVRDNASWAYPTNNILIFSRSGKVIAASAQNDDPNSSNGANTLWIKGDNKLLVSGGIDGPTGGRVPISTSTSSYMTFTIETSADFQKKTLIWTVNSDGLTFLHKSVIQDSGRTPLPYSAMGSSDVVKTFIIDHPTDSDRYLVHAAIEGPQNRVYYRGKTTLQHGQAFVALPDYFEGLTQEEHRAVFLQNMSGFDKVTVKTQDGKRIKNGVLHIVSQDKHSQSIVSWEVSAVRKDVPDLIVAPRVDEVEVLGFGPYRYVVPRE